MGTEDNYVKHLYYSSTNEIGSKFIKLIYNFL